MSTLLRDLIDIPERVRDEDYVLKLSEFVDDHAAAALADYVVTEQLVDAFDHALGLVGQALTSGNSAGAYLEGSFGSGKSHFMAVLHAILREHPAARDKAELRDVITRHNPALAGRRVMPLAFHLLGATSLEEAVFSQYVAQVRRLHPDAELPRLHRTDDLLANADQLRATMGDQAFLAALGDAAPAGASAGWGSFGAATGWTADAYEAARHAPHGDDARARLVDALVRGLLPAFGTSTDFVDIDTGLVEISRHAKTLGYDGVVLFLDELILWLAFGVHDVEFFRRESQKLTKFVEAGAGRRAIPLISIIARQMDLRRWFADAGASGAQQAALEQAFAYQSGRFASIVLGDDNLPHVAHQRLLQPRDDAAAARIAAAFAAIDRAPGVWDTLLDNANTDEQHRGSDEAAFKLTYPFSPALVSTLRALAAAMQRERTALKVMQRLLVERRDTLTVDDVIPVGDCFDLVVLGNEPLDSATAALFSSAKDVWENKLHPVILQIHGLGRADLAGDKPLPRGYEADVRLGKTLILSAVAPKVPALKHLTPRRLAALNHGSIVAPIPGAEAQAALSKVRTWAADVPEIQVDTTGREPAIAVQLTDVDYESIVAKAGIEDNEGRRRQLIQRIVKSAFGIEAGAEPDLEGAYRTTTTWRATPRVVDVVFGNVRDASSLPDDRFRAAPDTWRLVVDFPFDEQGFSSEDDISRYHRLNSRELDTRTIVWLPHFLSDARMRDLSRLVVLDWLLSGTGDRWEQHANHLREQDRVLARNILEGQRNTLERTITDTIQQAYGAATRGRANLVDDPGHEKELYSLSRVFTPQPPVGATLGDAFQHLVAQAWDNTYPEHPRFDLDGGVLRARELGTLKRSIEAAMADPERRVPVDTVDSRILRRVANPARIGQATETHYIFGDAYMPWAVELDKALALRGNPDDPVTITEAREWIAGLGLGLTEPVADLVIIAWAALRQRVWYVRGAAEHHAPEPGQLTAAMDLRTQELPTQEEWDQARDTAGHLFGITFPRYLNPQAVAALAEKVRAAAAELREPASGLVGVLDDSYRRAGVTDASGAPRLTTARSAHDIVDRLAQLDGVHLVRALAGIDLAGTGPAMSLSLTTAGQVRAALSGFRWERLADALAARDGEGERAEAAARILNDFARRARADQREHPMHDALRTLDEENFEWLRGATPAAPPAQTPPDAPTPPPTATPGASGEVAAAADSVAGTAEEVAAVLRDRLRGGVRYEVTWRVIE
ncbi:MAG: hypothetical protein Q4G43_10515 [Mobilicoccus sp.]|nr:hypothetical protein [Mobilicoccus sp.]